MILKRRRNTRKVICDINITNLVDVIFTLLIIFMITAPMMIQGVQVDLPKTDSKNVEVNQYIQVSITGTSEIFIDQERTNLVDFRRRFNSVFAGRKAVPVFLNADKKVPYGVVIKIITEIQNVGVEKLGFFTLPQDKKGQ